MTSKEELSSIAFSMKYRCSPKYVYKAEKDNFTKIEKDLEMLENLKQNLKYDIDGNIVLKIGYKNKNYKVVKEWLENEKNN